MNRPSNRPCPACGGAEGEILHTQRTRLPDQYPQAREVDVAICSRCGGAFADTRVGADGFEQFYSTALEFRLDLAPFDATAPIAAPPWDLERFEEVADLVERALPNRSGRILDLGCGSGALVATLRRRGFARVVGLDASPAAVARGRALGLDTRVGRLSAIPEGLGRFDLVLLSHVLEHLPAPNEALRAVAGLLTEDGQLYVEVPDASRFPEHDYVPFTEFNTEHINYFSPTTLTRLLDRAGFAAREVAGKTITVQPGFRYPALFGRWVARASGPAAEVRRDAALRGQILAYIARAQRVVDRLDAGVLAELAGRTTVAVRGLGNVAWLLLGCTALSRLEIAAYVDGSPDKQGLSIDGVRIVGPEVQLAPEIPVIVLSVLHERAIREDILRREPGRAVLTVSKYL